MIKEIKKKKIIVIGDIMLDEYYLGDVKRISPEAPVPVFNKKDHYCSMGGAANVAQNLIAANQNVSIISVVGNDKQGQQLLGLLQDSGIDTSSIILSSNRCTTVKTRFLAENGQQLMRVDEETSLELCDEEYLQLKELFTNAIAKCELLIISDYRKGLLNEDFSKYIINLANENEVPVIVDVKGSNPDLYYGATIIKPNKKELADLVGFSVKSYDEVVKASRDLLGRMNAKYIITTCGAEGMILVSNNEEKKYDSIKREVFDVTGAGDTAVAYLATCIANNYDMDSAIGVSIVASGLQVGKVGTKPIGLSEVIEAFDNISSRKKLIKKEELLKIRNENIERTVVFTNGCFDILHVGHIRYLKEAAKLGDVLIIGLNSDGSIKRIKGNNRPINDERDRVEMLAAYDFVDYIVVFDEDTPYDIIKILKPDIIVKGADYTNKEIVGRDLVESYGGRVELVPYITGKSTSNIINNVREKIR